MVKKDRKTVYLDSSLWAILDLKSGNKFAVSTTSKLIYSILMSYFNHLKSKNPFEFNTYKDLINSSAPELLDYFMTITNTNNNLQKNKNDDIDVVEEDVVERDEISFEEPGSETGLVTEMAEEEFVEPVAEKNQRGGKLALFYLGGKGVSTRARIASMFDFYDQEARDLAGPRENYADSDYAKEHPDNVRVLPGDSLCPEGVTMYDSLDRVVDVEEYYSVNRNWLEFLKENSPEEYAEYTSDEF